MDGPAKESPGAPGKHQEHITRRDRNLDYFMLKARHHPERWPMVGKLFDRAVFPEDGSVNPTSVGPTHRVALQNEHPRGHELVPRIELVSVETIVDAREQRLRRFTLEAELGAETLGRP